MRCTQQGYNILEIAIVSAIVALLAAIAYPTYTRQVEKAQTGTASRDISAIAQEIEKFQTRMGRLPLDLGEISMSGLRDPWHSPYVYLNMFENETNFRVGGGVGTPPNTRQDAFGRPVNSDYDLYSFGPDGISVPSLKGSASLDDVVRCKDGSFIGQARDFD
jgi:general secretion pathway protein G